LSEKFKSARYRWTHAVGQSKLSLGHKAVMLMRAEHTAFNIGGAFSWLSQQQLERDLGCARKTANLADAAAVRAGLMRAEEILPSGTVKYRLIIPEASEFPCTARKKVSQDDSPLSQDDSPGVSQDDSPLSQDDSPPCVRMTHDLKREKSSAAQEKLQGSDYPPSASLNCSSGDPAPTASARATCRDEIADAARRMAEVSGDTVREEKALLRQHAYDKSLSPQDNARYIREIADGYVRSRRPLAEKRRRIGDDEARTNPPTLDHLLNWRSR
jgi:hypothetical protein